MVLQQFILLLRNTSKAMNDLQVMVPGKMLFSIFEKKINVIKLKREKHRLYWFRDNYVFVLLIFSKKNNNSPEGFFTFFPKLCARGKGSNCLFINPMVLKFFEEKALIPTIPSLGKNTLL